MYENEEGIWSLSEIVNNAKEERRCMADLWYIIRHQPREVREAFSEFYFDGMDYYIDKNHPMQNDYINCCLEEAISFAKEMYRK